MRRLILYPVAIFLLMNFADLRALGQDYPAPPWTGNNTGIQPFGTYDGVRENISLGGGDLNLYIPLLNLPGRNGLNFTLGLVYDSNLWSLHDTYVAFSNSHNLNWQVDPGVPEGLWRLAAPTLAMQHAFVGLYGTPTTDTYCNTNFVLTTSDGSKHAFANLIQSSCNCNYGTCPLNVPISESADGSLIRLDTTNPNDIVAKLKDGTIIHFTSAGPGSQFFTSITDTNGNQITSTSSSGSTTFTDTSGRQVTISSSGNISYKDSNSNLQTITQGFTPVGGTAPAFPNPTPSQCYLFHPGPNTYLGGPGTVVNNIGGTGFLTQSNGTGGLTYQFTYDGYGRLTKIVYPSGGYSRYAYSFFSPIDYNFGAGDCSAASISYVSARYQCRNSSGYCATEDITAYNRNGSVLDVIDATLAQNRTNYQFGYSSWPGFGVRELQRQYYSGQNTLLKTVSTTYTDGVIDYSLPASITTTLNDVSPNLQSKVVYTYQKIAVPTTIYGNINNGVLPVDSPLTITEYGYDGSIIRQTTNTLLNSGNYVEGQLHILDRKLTTIATDPSASNWSKTLYEYDNYTQGLTASGAIQHLSVGTTRGNVTAVQRWQNQSTTLPVTRYQFDDAGNVVSITDPKGNTTIYAYADSWGNTTCAPASGSTTAYRTSERNALGQTSSAGYNSCTGTVASSKDLNQQTTTYAYDAIGRMTQTIRPDGGQSATTYNDVPPVSSTNTTSINTGSNLITTMIEDGFGRVSQTQLNSDPQGIVYTDTTYDAFGRVATVSNPYRSGTDITTTSGTTTYGYDALGRKISETYPDNSVLTTAYCGSSTLVTDPTGKWRRSRVDALGRLVEVDEPNAIGATVASTGCPGTGEPIWVTSYTNDALGNLTQVLQNGSHRRNFTFDSLSRLLCSSNPESSTAACPTPDPGTYTIGTTRYSYDLNSNVATKTDARNITITYGYDVLNRLTSRTYSNGDSSVAITYDGSCGGNSGCTNIGHRTAMTDAAGSESWAYWDNQDHFYYSRTITIGLSNVIQARDYYTDFLGHITFLHYPNSGRSLNTFYDSAGRPGTMRDSGPAGQLVGAGQTPPSGCPSSGVCYTPQGSVYSMNITNSGGSGLNIITTYNNRLQPNEFKASSTGGNAIDISYSFLDPLHSNKNAGHVFSITNNLDTTRSQTFTYDQLNRISSALTTSTHATSPTHCWGETYQYDGVTNGAWGNLTQIAATTNSAYTGCSQESGFTTTADGNNHLTSFSYDLSGNTQNDGVNSYTWDAESQLKSAGGVTYAYDGDGRRVAKVGSKLYWYGPSDEVLDETDTAGNLLNTYFYFAGKRVEAWPVGSSNLYYSEDHLGSSRIITTSAGVVCYDADFYPYGGERPYTNSCPQNYKFEGKERDTETGNDDFGARYYSNRFGRWLSADWSAVPVAVPYANLTNPQTLNLYSMVSDDPESFADLDGHCLPCAIEEAANSPAGQWLLDNTIGLAIAGGAAIYAESKGWFNKAADFIQANPSVTGPDPAVDLRNATLSENTSDSKPGEVYVTEPQAGSDKPYVGRTTQGTDKRMETRTDGRTGKATTVDTYKSKEEGQYKEQKAMDQRGGKANLDNKRNEVNPQRMKELDKKCGPPKTAQPPVKPAPAPKPCTTSTSTSTAGTC